MKYTDLETSTPHHLVRSHRRTEGRPSLRVVSESPEENEHLTVAANGTEPDPNDLFGDDETFGDPQNSGDSGIRPRHYPPKLPQPRTDSGGSAIARVPLAQIRLILRELDTGDHDLRTVLAHCQGFAPASPEFRKIYLDARLAVLESERTREQRHSLRSEMAFAAAATAECPPASPPFQVVNPVDLLRHCGLWVMIAGGLELWNSWQIALVLDQYLLGGVRFLAVATAFAFLGLDSLLWLRLRGSHVSRFTLPGTILVTALAAIAAAFHLHHAIAAMLAGDSLPR